MRASLLVFELLAALRQRALKHRAVFRNELFLEKPLRWIAGRALIEIDEYAAVSVTNDRARVPSCVAMCRRAVDNTITDIEQRRAMFCSSEWSHGRVVTGPQ